MAGRMKRNRASGNEPLSSHGQDQALPPTKRRSARSSRSSAQRPLDSKSQTSHFLKLPAELREWVYTFVAQSTHTLLRPASGGKLLNDSPLLRVSRQCNDEYTKVLRREAPAIIAQVVDFDFSHVVKFLNSLTEIELNAIRTELPDRVLRIRIFATPHCPRNPESLHRWLRRCAHPTKKGHDIDFQYRVSIWHGTGNWFHYLAGQFNFGIPEVWPVDTGEAE
ncbi:hypothetical protein LTR86_007807 [Recurvomyces mirabilis]|nr:hypothetical protein LTR86_007807 [Recurvomyces mirabilis]